MSQIYTDADGLVHFRDDTREIIIKSSLSGVVATVLAVAIWSPAGLGGMIGTSMAAGTDVNTGPAADALANLAAYPAPLTIVELTDIRSKLSATEASLEAMRARTDEDIRHMRAIASRVSVEPLAMSGPVGAPLAIRETTQVYAEAAPVEASVVEAAAAASVIPVQYEQQGAQFAENAAQLTFTSLSPNEAVPDRHMEFAELLLRR